MDKEHNDFRAEIDQAQASARDSVPVVTTMYRGFRKEGLGFMESVFLATVWIWVAGHKHLADPDNR
jgi:hypothetical protein